MGVKEEVMDILDRHREIYYSGEVLAKELGVSRAAVSKAVKALRKEGYVIDSIQNRGYQMQQGSDILSATGIRKYLSLALQEKIQIEVYQQITSTNTVLKEKAMNGAPEWQVLLAKEQTAGRGRMNRSFYSPMDSGIYMSILFRPAFAAAEALALTTMTAVAAAEAIDTTFGIRTGIKWVNDLYYGDKKIAGILTEAAVNVENARLDYAVVGIGINVKEPQAGFPEEIQRIAGSVMNGQGEERTEDDLKNRLVAAILQNMENYYLELDSRRFMNTYREKSILTGKEVYMLSDETREPLVVMGIDEDAALVVRHQSGRIEKLRSGEVSVRLCSG